MSFGGFFRDLFKPFVPKGPEDYISGNPNAASILRDIEGQLGYIPEEMYSAGKLGTLGGVSMVAGMPAGSFGSSGMLGSILGSAISGGLGLAGGLASSALNYKYQKKLMEKQDAMQRAYARDAAGISKAGMEKAGLNPLLASGSGYSTSTEPLNPSSNNSDLAGSMASMMNSAASMKQSIAADKNANTQENVGKSTVNLNRSQIATNNANIANNTAKTQAEIYNDTRMTDAKIKALGAQIGRWKSESDWAKAHPWLSNMLGKGINFNFGANFGGNVSHHSARNISRSVSDSYIWYGQ